MTVRTRHEITEDPGFVPAGSLAEDPAHSRDKRRNYYIYLMTVRTRHEITEDPGFVPAGSLAEDPAHSRDKRRNYYIYLMTVRTRHEITEDPGFVPAGSLAEDPAHSRDKRRNYYIYLMTVRTRHEITEDTWFITFTNYNWIPLFDITNSYDLIYKWLKLAYDKYQIKTNAFVIMPNHVHLLLHLTNQQVNLNTIISNAKRFMAYELVERLKQEQKHDILNILSLACSEKERAKGQLHKAFEPSFDAKPLYTLQFLYQKLDYIHHNPVSGKWHLSDEFTGYPHSSAAFYELGQPHPFVQITDYRLAWC